MTKIAAIDVDLTVVDTYNPWMRWFEELSGGKQVKNEDRAYDLLPEMIQLLKGTLNEKANPFDFWHLSDLYDHLEPEPWSVNKLHAMKDLGWEIVFVSTCIAEHRNSKIKFLQKHFPFMDGFIDTRDKHFIAYDLLVDDKIAHHEIGRKYRPNAMHLLYTAIRRDGTDEESEKYNQLPGWGSLSLKYEAYHSKMR